MVQCHGVGKEIPDHDKEVDDMGYTIYIADDEKNIRDLIKSFLESDGYHVVAFETGDMLMEEFDRNPADLLILDIMMPGTDGLTVCRRLREKTDVPIIMLTAKDSELDYVQGITSGSDDYLAKPFRPTVLLMRVRALLRRIEMEKKKNQKTETLPETSVGDLRYLPERSDVFLGNTPVGLTQTELKMLGYMMQKPEKAYSRGELLDVIWGFDQEVETRVTDETVRRTRKKLADAGSNVTIQTVWGYGYKREVKAL